jgi:curved DNA-binding protein CbpA
MVLGPTPFNSNIEATAIDMTNYSKKGTAGDDWWRKRNGSSATHASNPRGTKHETSIMAPAQTGDRRMKTQTLSSASYGGEVQQRDEPTSRRSKNGAQSTESENKKVNSRSSSHNPGMSASSIIDSSREVVSKGNATNSIEPAWMTSWRTRERKSSNSNVLSPQSEPTKVEMAEEVSCSTSRSSDSCSLLSSDPIDTVLATSMIRTNFNPSGRLQTATSKSSSAVPPISPSLARSMSLATRLQQWQQHQQPSKANLSTSSFGSRRSGTSDSTQPRSNRSSSNRARNLQPGMLTPVKARPLSSNVASPILTSNTPNTVMSTPDVDDGDNNLDSSTNHGQDTHNKRFPSISRRNLQVISEAFGEDACLYRDVLNVEPDVTDRHLRIAYFRRGRQVLADSTPTTSTKTTGDDGNVNRKVISKIAQKVKFKAVSIAYEMLSQLSHRDLFHRVGHSVSSLFPYAVDDNEGEGTTADFIVSPMTSREPSSSDERKLHPDMNNNDDDLLSVMSAPSQRPPKRDDLNPSNLSSTSSLRSSRFAGKDLMSANMLSTEGSDNIHLATDVRRCVSAGRATSPGVRWSEQVVELLYRQDEDERCYKTAPPPPPRRNVVILDTATILSSSSSSSKAASTNHGTKPSRLDNADDERSVQSKVSTASSSVEMLQHLVGLDRASAASEYVTTFLDNVEASLDNWESGLDGVIQRYLDNSSVDNSIAVKEVSLNKLPKSKAREKRNSLTEQSINDLHEEGKVTTTDSNSANRNLNQKIPKEHSEIKKFGFNRVVASSNVDVDQEKKAFGSPPEMENEKEKEENEAADMMYASLTKPPPSMIDAVTENTFTSHDGDVNASFPTPVTRNSSSALHRRRRIENNNYLQSSAKSTKEYFGANSTHGDCVPTFDPFRIDGHPTNVLRPSNASAFGHFTQTPSMKNDLPGARRLENAAASNIASKDIATDFDHFANVDESQAIIYESEAAMSTCEQEFSDTKSNPAWRSRRFAARGSDIDSVSTITADYGRFLSSAKKITSKSSIDPSVEEAAMFAQMTRQPSWLLNQTEDTDVFDGLLDDEDEGSLLQPSRPDPPSQSSSLGHQFELRGSQNLSVHSQSEPRENDGPYLINHAAINSSNKMKSSTSSDGDFFLHLQTYIQNLTSEISRWGDECGKGWQSIQQTVIDSLILSDDDVVGMLDSVGKEKPGDVSVCSKGAASSGGIGRTHSL